MAYSFMRGQAWMYYGGSLTLVGDPKGAREAYQTGLKEDRFRGGTRQCTIHWPNGFKGRGEIRTQFSHVIDVAATVLDAAGIPEPAFVNGTQQMPLQGQAWSRPSTTQPRPSSGRRSTSR